MKNGRTIILAAIVFICFIYHRAIADSETRVDWNRVELKARQAISAHDEEYVKMEKQWTCIELRVNMFAEASLGAVFMLMQPERDHIIDNHRILEYRTLSVQMPFNLDSKEAHVLDGTYRRKEPVHVKKKGERDRIHVLCTSAAIEKDQKSRELLLALEYDVNKTDGEGMSLLHIATLGDDMELVRHFLKQGANVNLATNTGQTPLHSAAIVNSRPIAELLIADGADIHAKDNKGGAPLHWAAAFNRPDIVRLLLNAGASPHLKDEGGDSPLEIARKLGHEDVLAAMLIAHGPGENESAERSVRKEKVDR